MSHTSRLRMNKTISGPERNMVLRVLKYFESEKYDPDSLIPISKVLKRTSVATGVSISSIKRIRREEKTIIASLGNPDTASEVPLPTPGSRRRKRKDKLEYSAKMIKGLRTVIDSYQRAHDKMMPLKDIFEVAKQNLDFPGQKETLRKLLVDELGYTFESYKTRQSTCKQNVACKRKSESKPEISSIFLENSLKLEAEDFNEMNSENIKTEAVEMDVMEPESILCEVEIEEEFL